MGISDISVTAVNALHPVLFDTGGHFGARMKSVLAIFLLTCGIVFNAGADVWKWVDEKGVTHFVDTNRSIYTWADNYGKVYFSDKPDHEDAVSVQLVWVSPGSVDELKDGTKDGGDDIGDSGYAYPGETAEQRATREAAEDYYCTRATEIYDSYVNAPQLYRTNDDGEREYLDDKEAATTIAETKAKMDDICG